MKADGPLKNTEKSLSSGLLDITGLAVDDRVRDRAVLHLIDWMGCAIAGRKTEIGRIFRDGDGLPQVTNDPMSEALAYGALGSILEMDDVHRTALLHPGPVVIPAALALSGHDEPGDFLDAIVQGYEAMIRVGRSVGAAHYASFHNTATCGGAGSAVASARMLKLDAERSVWALGNAMTLASGLWECRNEPVFTKPLHVAEACRRGVQAAFYAARGLSGPSRIFEGSQGFFAGLARDGRPDFMLVDPDGPWLIEETSFKPWPACRHAHATIDATLEARSQIGSRAIRAIRIFTYADAVRFCDKPAPQTVGEAKFSLQHAAAVVLTKGIPMLEDFEPDAIARPEFAQLRRLAEVHADSGLTADYPAHFGSRVDIDLADGTTVSATVADALGDSENPMAESAIIDKFHTLCTWAGVSDREQAPLIALAKDLRSGAPVASLKAALSTHL